jgi:phosphatidylinositol glycan class B
MNNKRCLKPYYIGIAGIIYLITAFFSLGHLHPDEYYQILEFAAFKLHLNSAHGLTWEFYQQIRPTFMPWIIVGIYKIYAYLSSPNPFMVAFFSRVLAGALSLSALILFICTFKSQLPTSRQQYWFILLSLFSWLAVFNGIRFSSENIGAKLFLIAMCLLLPQWRKNLFSYLGCGLLLGLAVSTRFQIGFMVLGLLAWLYFKHQLKLSSWLSLLSGIGAAIIACLILDHNFYGAWVFTPWRYFAANIIAGKAATFSVDHWYMYLAIAGLVPYGPLYILASAYFMLLRRTHVITWVMLPFILSHLLVSHKELRFLTPLLSFMPFVIIDSLQVLTTRYNYKLSNKLKQINSFSWYFNAVVVAIVMFIPAAMQIRINQLLYKDYQKPSIFYYITEGGNILDFYKHLNLDLRAINTPRQAQCSPTKNCLIALTCQETIKYGPQTGRLVFSDCPSWIFKLDFNGWLERTALYNIYELQNIEQQ